MENVLELRTNSTPEEVQNLIRGAYRQVWGNPHVMESERLVAAESQLCNRAISVREFVRLLAKSEFYRRRHFESCAPYRFVELNFLHLLGRAPQDQQEVSAHIVRCHAEGYDAEIDSYLDSDEYKAAFGENTVPYVRGNRSEANAKQVGYNRIFALDRGPAQVSSAVTGSQLVYGVATNTANVIRPARVTFTSGTEKAFRIEVFGGKMGNMRRSRTEYRVTKANMTAQIQQILRSGGKIASITETL
ncbi:MAG TPA: photosystem I reaction center subunit XII [Cyanobacteria bacterium UBA8156]|jgi:phycoerythrin-associated linker protein|nr:photosystem I reaction center subunit XII [Cyanobacteria bacterium UBA8156]